MSNSYEESDSDNEEIDYENVVFNLKNVEEPQAILFKTDISNNQKNSFLNRIGQTYIWEDLLLLVVDTMLIDRHYISKLTYLFFYLMELKFPHFLEQIKDSVYKYTINQIWEMMNKKPVYPLPELFPRFGMSLRLIKKTSPLMSKISPYLFKEKHQIEILGFTQGYMKFQIPVDRADEFIISNKGPRDSFGQFVTVEKRLNDIEFTNLIKLLTKFYQGESLHSDNRYDPLLYIITKSKFELVTTDMLSNWF